MDAKNVVALEVVEIETGRVVHTVPLRQPADERHIDRVIGGMLINMDTERFFVREKVEA